MDLFHNIFISMVWFERTIMELSMGAMLNTTADAFNLENACINWKTADSELISFSGILPSMTVLAS